MIPISFQNGGADTFYESESVSDENSENGTVDETVEIYQKRRSYILITINKDLYDLILKNIEKLRHGDRTSTRSGALEVRVFKPGDRIVIDRVLLTTDDYKYPDKIMCYSSVFTPDVILENPLDIDTYRLFGFDLIWCREDTLFERLQQFFNIREE